MKINIKATGLDLTDSMREHVNVKIAPISKLVKRYDSGGDLVLSLEIARNTMHHHKGNVFYAEATLALPDKVLRVEVTDSDVHTAVNKVRDLLKRDLRKYKTARLFRFKR